MDNQTPNFDAYGPSKDKANNRDKRGALSNAEKAFIKDNAQVLTIQQISDKINKSLKSIERYAYKNNIALKSADGDDRILRLRQALKNRQYYKDLKLQFSIDELSDFEQKWVEIMIQFDEDVLPLEEMQVCKHITLDIIKNRFLKKTYSIELQIDQTQKMIDIENNSGAPNIQMVGKLTTIIDKLQNKQLAINKEISTVVDKIKDTEKALKGSRDQRVKEFVDAEKNWVNTIRLLDKIEVREQLGKHIELHRLAQIKEMDRLYSLHTFANKTVDKLVLNSESVELGEEENEHDTIK